MDVRPVDSALALVRSRVTPPMQSSMIMTEKELLLFAEDQVFTIVRDESISDYSGNTSDHGSASQGQNAKFAEIPQFRRYVPGYLIPVKRQALEFG